MTFSHEKTAALDGQLVPFHTAPSPFLIKTRFLLLQGRCGAVVLNGLRMGETRSDRHTDILWIADIRVPVDTELQAVTNG